MIKKNLKMKINMAIVYRTQEMVDMFWKDTYNAVTWNGAHLCKHHKTIMVKSSYKT